MVTPKRPGSTVPIQVAREALGSAIPHKGEAGWRAKKGPHPKNKSGFHPTGHLLLLRGQQIEEKTESGLYLIRETAEADRAKSVLMDVIEIGPGCWDDQVHDFCEVGDKVLIGEYVGKMHISYLDGVEYRFVRDLDILTTVEMEQTAKEACDGCGK